MNIVNKSLILLLVSSLPACSTVSNFKKTDKTVESNQASSQRTLDQLQSGSNTQVSDVLQSHNGNYVEPKAIDEKAAAEKEREKKALACSVNVTLWQPISLLEFSNMATQLCGIRVRTTPDAMSSDVAQAAAHPDIELKKANEKDKEKEEKKPPVTVKTPSSFTGPTISGVKYQGTFEGLLDRVTTKIGLSWKVSNGVVTIYRVDTRVFPLKTVCSSSSLTSTITSGISSSGGKEGSSQSGSSSQGADITTKMDLCADIQKTVNTMLTPNLGRAVLSPSTNTLVVTDTESVLTTVQNYIEQQSKLLSKQVLFNVKILSITLSDSDAVGFSLDTVQRVLSGKLGIKVFGGSSLKAASEGGMSGIGVLNRDQSQGAIATALSGLGKISEVTSPSITTLNMQPAPLQIGQQQGYLAESSTTLIQGGGAQTELKPGTITSGFNMTLLPFIASLNDKFFNLQYEMNVSNLEDLKEIKSDASKIQLPQVSTRVFHQTVRMQSGETLIMGGFEQTRDELKSSGPLNPWNILFGGKASRENKKTVIVILVTPTVLN